MTDAINNNTRIALRQHYTAFLRDDRILLTGHSHQAWPDCAKTGLLESYDDAVRAVDDKWSLAEEKAKVLGDRIGAFFGADSERVVLADNTQTLLLRALSSFDFVTRRKIITTDGEFHSMRRQLHALSERTGAEIVRVPTTPTDTLSERVAAAIDGDTLAVMMSSVLFETSELIQNLERVAERALQFGTQVIFDSYHHFPIHPWPKTTRTGPMEHVFVVGGGYKYAQWGEGCCFLVTPHGDWRPAITGWFAEFPTLAAPSTSGLVYGKHPRDAFAGSTYDPASHYRAAAVVQFFDEHGLDTPSLQATYQALLEDMKTYCEPEMMINDSPIGFLPLRASNPDAAQKVVERLRNNGIWVDARGAIVRVGPAPYTTDEELALAMPQIVAELKASA